MIRRTRKPPTGRLRHISPDRPAKAEKDLNSTWSSELEGEDVDFEEPVEGDVDEERDYDLDLVDDDRDDGYDETYYSDDFEDDDDERSNDGDDDESLEIDFRTIHLRHGFQLLVPYDEVCDDSCKVEMLSAESRTELLSEFKHISDDIVISDAYEVADPDSKFTNSSSRSKLQFPLVLPTTRLNHADLFRFHVMARERNGDWKKVPAHYQNSTLTFPLKGVQFFIAYAQPIPEFSNVTSSGFTFKSAKSEKISVEIPEGAVDREIRMRLKVHPVDMDRMNAYEAFDPGSINCIYALTDILYVRHTMDNVLQREGSVKMPIETVDEDHDIICFKRTSKHNEIVYCGKDHVVKNGQVELPYEGDPKTSFQVACVRRGANSDDIKHDAAYLNGQVDSCTILFFISKDNEDRYLTVDVVDRASEESVRLNRCKRGFYEIKNSRLSGAKLEAKKRIRVDLSGNMQSTERTKFTFVYNPRCKNNSIYFRTTKNLYGNYSIVNVLFDGSKIHEIHFNYPDIGQKLVEIKNLFVLTIDRRTSSSTSDSGYNTERTGLSKSDLSPSEQQTKKHKLEKDLKLESKPNSKSMLETETEPESKLKAKQEPGMGQESKIESDQEQELELKSDSESESESEPEAELSKTGRTSRRDLPSGTKAAITPSDQRPGSASTDVSSVHDHPILQDDSLLVLATNMLQEDVNKLMIMAGFRMDEIIRIRRKVKGFDENFLLFDEWRTKKKSVLRLSDDSALRSLEQELKEIKRSDLAQILNRLIKKTKPRGFRNKDFKN